MDVVEYEQRRTFSDRSAQQLQDSVGNREARHLGIAVGLDWELPHDDVDPTRPIVADVEQIRIALGEVTHQLRPRPQPSRCCRLPTCRPTHMYAFSAGSLRR